MSDDVCLAEFEKYLTDVKKSSANTLASYMRDIRQLEGYLSSHGRPGLEEAGEDDLAAYTAWMKGNGKSAATVARCIASLKCFYTFLQNEGEIDELPTTKLVPEKAAHKLPQLLTSK